MVDDNNDKDELVELRVKVLKSTVEQLQAVADHSVDHRGKHIYGEIEELRLSNLLIDQAELLYEKCFSPDDLVNKFGYTHVPHFTDLDDMEP